VAGQWHLDAENYLTAIRAEVRSYDDLQGRLADATGEVDARSILDLGSGTGVTADRVIRRHPDAALIGIDASADMIDLARRNLPDQTFVQQRLEDPLPPGPFDLVVSAFAIHHLSGSDKRVLFRRIATVLRPGGRFVMCDVVVPTAAVARPVPLEAGVDCPDTVADQLRWLADAQLDASQLLAHADLAILQADRR
jgi:tRNA (cmo5U34)-methyltransferase